MKRTKFLAMILVVAVMMMGAGYAYWSDTLTINNTVSTGEMNVEFTNSSVTAVADDYIDNTVAPVLTESTANEKDLVFVASNLYPGASVELYAEFQNTGTIPVVLQDLVFVDQTATLTNNNDEVLTQVSLEDKAHFLVSGSVSYDGETVNIPAGTTLANVQERVNSVLPRQLEPGNIGELDFTITLDSGLENDDLENSYVKTLITFDFEQHNE